MRNRKKLLGIFLTLALVLSTIITVPANAAGTQTLYKTPPSGANIGGFHCYDNNTTPVKTIGESGSFYIFGTAKKGDNLSGNVKVKIEIRDHSTGAVLKRTESYPVSVDGTAHAFETEPINVYAGQKLQIFFDVCSVGTPPGGYRSADINYSYCLQ